MIREQKNKFWLTLILILSLSFSAFALGVASIFSVKENVVKADASNTAGVMSRVLRENKVAGKWKVNGEEKLYEEGESSLSIEDPLYGGTTISVEEVADLNTAKNADNSADETWHSTLQIRIKNDSKSVNVTYQPYIQPGYKLVGFYFKGDTTYSNTAADDTNPTLFEKGESATTEQIDPEYKGNITIKAVCEPITYSVYMYYSTDGKKWIETDAAFNNDNESSLARLNITKTNESNVSAFKYWAIKAYDKKTDKTLVTKTGENVYVNTNENIIFTLADKSGDNATTEVGLSENLFDSFKDGEGNRYFYVDKIKGYSSEIDNFKESDYLNYGATDPVIRATWSYIFNVEIENKATNSINSTKVGTFSTDEKTNDGNDKTAPLKVANTPDYAFNFYANTGKAFETLSSKLEEMGKEYGVSNDKYYYVYNYGYEITGWKIYFTSGGKNVYLSYNKGTAKWSYSQGVTVPNDITDLNGSNTADMSGYAQTLDAFFIGGYSNTIITMEPVWQKVSFNLVANFEVGEISKKYTLNDNVTYGGAYSFDDTYNQIAGTGVFAPSGKSIYYYTCVKGGNIIARHSNKGNITWNYVNIPQSSFDYDDGYTLNVAPEYVDKIHQITLSGEMYNSTTGSYNLKASATDARQYYFAKAGSINAPEYIITSSDLSLGYNDYSSGSVETYIVNTVTPVKSAYETRIADGSLNILRKVYTTNSSANLSNNNLKYTTTNDNEVFYIYLANNRKSGYLPVFERSYYDLIAWDNVVDASTKYAYATTSYIEAEHKPEFDDYTCYLNHDHSAGCEKIRDINAEPYWSYNELGSAEFNAYYFRKNYLLDLNTLRDGTTNEGRYGYIYVEIIDKTDAKDKNEKFIAVYDNEEASMQYYAVASASIKAIESGSLATVGENPLIKEKDGIACVVVYAGCDLTIKASCVDYFNGDDITYADMVGYYLKSINTENDGKDLNTGVAKNNLFDNVNYDNIQNKYAGKHSITISAADIESFGYPTSTKIVIDAHFAPIDYNITVTLKTGIDNNPFAGRVDCVNKTTTNEESTISFKGNVETWSELIEYLANAGYTLSANAITTFDRDGQEHVLLSYNLEKNTGDVVDEVNGIINKQEYAFNLNGEWLIKYYYAQEYCALIEVKDEEGNIETEAQTLALNVNTELVNFKYWIEIVDENGIKLNEYQNGTMVLDGKTDRSNNAKIFGVTSKNTLATGVGEYTHISRALVANEFSLINDGNNFYVVKVLNCATEHTHTNECYKNYVILQSRLSQIIGGNDYAKDYNFVLKAENIDASTSEIDILPQSRLNTIYGFGNIVNIEERKLIMQIKVAELYTITLQAQKHSTLPDGGLTDRITTIKNHRNISGELTNSISLTTTGLDFDTTQIVYTYKGVNNYISVVYDTDMYEKATFSLGGSISNIGSIALGTTSNEVIFTLDETKVDVSGNVVLNVVYVPKPITVFDVTYKFNGSEVSSINSSIFKDYKPSSNIELYYGQNVTYRYELLNQDYLVSVTLNGALMNSNPINCVVDSQVYQAKGFYLIVSVNEVDKRVAQFRYVLEDSATAFATDDYGTFDVLVGGNVVDLIAGSDGWYSAAIPENRAVAIDISDMSKGYHYVKLNRVSSNMNKSVVDNKLSVVDSFKFNETNIYNIVIAKDIVQAKLTVSSSYASDYIMSTSGIETIKQSQMVSTINAYLGKTLEFTDVDKDREKLDCYYWIDKTGTEHKIETINEDGKYTLDITSDVLLQLADKVENVYTLNIGVKTIAKYNLNYSIENANYAESYAVTLEDGTTNYVSGSNMLKNTKVLLNFIAKDNKINADGVTIEEAKYNIKLSGCVNQTYTLGEVKNLAIVLDADKTLTITFTPKTYSSTNNEYIYNTLSDYYNLTNAELANGVGSFELQGNVVYGETITAKFNRVNDERGELAVIRLSGNDANELIIHVDGKQIVSIYDKTENVEYVISETYAKHVSGANPATICKVTNLSDQLKTYGYTFVNTATDKVELSFVVKNVISITTEYLSYKTITIL